MTKMQCAIYRALLVRRNALIKQRVIAVFSHEKRSHILSEIQNCTHIMLKMENKNE